MGPGIWKAWLVAGVVWAVAGGVGVRAQAVANQGERYRIETSAAGGQDAVTITNTSAVPITGFRAAYDCGAPGKQASVVEDTVIMGMGAAAAAKSSLSFAVPELTKGCAGGVLAIAFADGQHVGGDPAWKQIVMQRSAAYAEASGLLALTEGMDAKSWSAAALEAKLAEMRKALAADRGMAGDERRGRMMALDVMRQYLDTEAKGPGSMVRTKTITRLIHWMNGMSDALGKEKVDLPSTVPPQG